MSSRLKTEQESAGIAEHGPDIDDPIRVLAWLFAKIGERTHCWVAVEQFRGERFERNAGVRCRLCGKWQADDGPSFAVCSVARIKPWTCLDKNGPHEWVRQHGYQDRTMARYRCVTCGCWGYRPRVIAGPWVPVCAYRGPVLDDEADRRWSYLGLQG